jgi:hypothetical protein
MAPPHFRSDRLTPTATATAPSTRPSRGVWCRRGRWSSGTDDDHRPLQVGSASASARATSRTALHARPRNGPPRHTASHRGPRPRPGAANPRGGACGPSSQVAGRRSTGPGSPWAGRAPDRGSRSRTRSSSRSDRRWLHSGLHRRIHTRSGGARGAGAQPRGRSRPGAVLVCPCCAPFPERPLLRAAWGTETGRRRARTRS